VTSQGNESATDSIWHLLLEEESSARITGALGALPADLVSLARALKSAPAIPPLGPWDEFLDLAVALISAHSPAQVKELLPLRACIEERADLDTWLTGVSERVWALSYELLTVIAAVLSAART
jgi:hypothetical protein